MGSLVISSEQTFNMQQALEETFSALPGVSVLRLIIVAAVIIVLQFRPLAIIKKLSNKKLRIIREYA